MYNCWQLKVSTRSATKSLCFCFFVLIAISFSPKQQLETKSKLKKLVQTNKLKAEKYDRKWKLEDTSSQRNVQKTNIKIRDSNILPCSWTHNFLMLEITVMWLENYFRVIPLKGLNRHKEGLNKQIKMYNNQSRNCTKSETGQNEQWDL